MLFLLATLLILYYKQLSEGREDQGRFQIMKKVGLDEDDVRRSVNSQMGAVFFAPLLVAGVHVAFDFPIISRLFTLFGLYDLGLELAYALGVFRPVHHPLRGDVPSHHPGLLSDGGVSQRDFPLAFFAVLG